jgi:hypothetical protein
MMAPAKQKEAFDRIADPKKREWFRMATNHSGLHASWCEIHHGGEPHKAWVGYFLEMGWSPVTFRMITRDKTWTAPCEWPADLPAR